MFLNIDGEDIPVKDFKVNLSKTDDDYVSFNKPDDTVEMRMENELPPEQKNILKEFLKGYDEKKKKKKSHTINGWYVHDCHDDLRYLHDTGYYAEHISTGQEISLGSEYNGLMNSLRFIEAITGQEGITNVNDCCYNCSYYYSQDMPAWGFGSWSEKYLRVNSIITAPTFFYDIYSKYPFKSYFKNN